MKLTKLLQCISVITFLSLVYIHMQMRIIDLAYRGEKKEDEIKRLSEHIGNLTYTILSLKSVNHLGDILLTENSDMQFADSEDIIQLATKEKIFETRNHQELVQIKPKRKTLATYLAFGTRAEAKNQE